jgi:hypothetical protein
MTEKPTTPGESPHDLLGGIRAAIDDESAARRSESRLAEWMESALRAPDGGLDFDIVRELGELATDSNRHLSEAGQRLVFGVIAETLGDSFEPSKVALYDSIFADLIEFCGHVPAGAGVRRQLEQFGIHSSADLLARRRRVAAMPRLSERLRSRIREVLILSRITVGADVAVTSLVLQKAERIFPDARHTVIGGGLDTLMTGPGGARVVALPYSKQSSLFDRLDAWTRLVRLLGAEIAEEPADACLVIDPDSRLTQLGLLPVAGHDVPYFFFESRSYRTAGLETLGSLTEDWLTQTFGSDEHGPLFSRVTPLSSDLAAATALVDALRRAGARQVVAVNLGVGNNPRKRIAGGFETDLVRSLIADGSVVILDRGVGEEVERTGLIAAALRSEGRSVVESTTDIRIDESGLTSCPDLVTYQGSLGRYAALIAGCDLYLGYDSAFQHIAAALGIPVIDIFVNPPNPRFAQRWRPHSRAPVRAIVSGATDDRQCLADVLQAYQDVRAAHRSGR